MAYQQQRIIVTGLSGAGKTMALKTLEDYGYEVMDNIPISLCPMIIQEKEPKRPLVLGIDIRTRGFEPESFIQHLKALRDQDRVKVLFFEADPQTIEARYREK